MTDFDKSGILLNDYSTVGAVLTATNLACNPGFETSDGLGGVKNVTASADVTASVSEDWQWHGPTSLRLTPNGSSNATYATVAGSTGSLVGNGVTFIAGHSYVAKARFEMLYPVVQTGTLNAAARSLRATFNGTGGTTVSVAAANTNGYPTQPLSISFTVPANATNCRIELWNGSSKVDEPVYWDDLLLVDTTAGGAYTGEWFSGSSFPPANQLVAWTGTPEDSTSTLTTLLGQEKITDLQALSFEYPGLSSNYADDDSISLGVANFTTKTTKNLKNLLGRIVWPRRNRDAPRRAIVRSVTKSEDVYTISADTGTTDLNYDYSFLPILVNETGVHLTTVDGKEFRPITSLWAINHGIYPGFVGNGLTAIAQLARTVTNAPLFVRDDPDNRSLVLDYPATNPRPTADRHTTVPKNIGNMTVTVERGEPARNIEVIWYEGGYGDDIEVIPEDADIISVGSGETVEVDIETDSWLKNVNQPVCVDWVESDKNYYTGTNGVYAVAGSDNLPITAAEWVANGGLVTVEISKEDPRTLHVTVRGMVSSGSTHTSPYRIAMVNTIGGDYPALRVTADAVKAVPHTLTLPTGVDETITKTDVGFTVDSPFIQSLDQAYRVGVPLARKYSGVVLSLSGSGEKITPLQVLDHEWMRYVVRDISGDENTSVSFDAELWTSMSEFQVAFPRATYTMQDFQNVWPRSEYTMGQFMLEMLRNPLKYGTGVFFSMYNGQWQADSPLVRDNGNGTWTSSVPVDNGNGTWTG